MNIIRGDKDCQYYERCGRTGHYLNDEGHIKRCACWERKVLKEKLGVWFMDNVTDTSKLTQFLDRNLVVESDIKSFKKNAFGALKTLVNRRKKFVAFDAYRLVDISFDKDDEQRNFTVFETSDLCIILMRYSVRKNVALPDMILQVLERREFDNLPTWIWVPMPIRSMVEKYSTDVCDKLSDTKVYKHVLIK